MIKALKEEEFYFKKRGVFGFLTKLTKKGEYPKNFINWAPTAKIEKHTETFRTGWQIIDFRIGESQQWAILKHPFGFYLEIYLSDFLTHMNSDSIINGKLLGYYKWSDRKLIKQD